MIEEFRSRVGQAPICRILVPVLDAFSDVKFSDSSAGTRKCPLRNNAAPRNWPFHYELYGTVMEHGGGVMSLARTAALAATALFLLCSAARAAGPYRPFQTGLWLGGAYTDDRTGSFSHCSAGVVYDGGINLFVVSTEGHGWWLGFTSPQWSLTPSASTPVKLQFDGRPPVEVLGTIADG
jgi:hypothetical protein